jgi:CheY-like chemotaxis protein
VNQKLATRLLEKAGHRVTPAGTGRQAVAAWENASTPGFDIVLMNIQMPEMDGMEATAAIRTREKKSRSHVPIVAMTTHAMRGDKERCPAGGMDGYISKPINPAGLFAEIERCLAGTEGSITMAENSQELHEQIDRV